jgi:surface antigen
MFEKSRQKVAALAAVTVLAVVASDARAQLFFSPDSGYYGLDLSKQDLDQLNEAADKAASEPIGTQEVWDNPSTGNRGTVQLVKELQQDGMRCLRLRQDIKQRDQPASQIYFIDRCKLPDGQWKLYPAEEN